MTDIDRLRAYCAQREAEVNDPLNSLDVDERASVTVHELRMLLDAIDAERSRLTRVLEVLRKVEWLDENKHVSTCPVCGGITPRLKDWVGTTGHTPDCALAALKREIEGANR